MADTGSRSALRARLREGLDARRRGERTEAERIFRDLLRDHPNHPDALNLLGVLLAERGDWTEAVRYLKAAAVTRPNSTPIAVNLAQALLGANRPGEACEILSTLNGRFGADTSGALYVRALLADRRPEEAEGIARQLLSASPGNPVLLCALADALVQSERAAEAIPHYEAAIAAAPDHAPAHNNLGTALEKAGRLPEAARALRRALHVAPHHTAARLNLGTVCLRLGDAAGATLTFAEVLRKEPYNQRALAYLDVARQQCGALKPRDARTALERLIHEAQLAAPEPFSTLTTFHAALTEELYRHPARRLDVSGTATTGGSDALRLFDHEAPALKALEKQLRSVIDAYIASRPYDSAHPYLGRRAQNYTLDAWATFLKPGGYQFPHIHPSGWISGVYYVQVPLSVYESSSGHEGWIEFNRPDESFEYTFRPEVILKRPVPGLLLFFPSYAYHRTIPFESGTDRISIAFDVKLATANMAAN